MLNVLSALTAAGVPGWRGAFRPTQAYPEPPDCYCVFLLTRTPTWEQDDGSSAERLRAFLHLYSKNDPESAQTAITAAMEQEGFRLIETMDGDYVPGAEDYEIFSEWVAMKDVSEV